MRPAFPVAVMLLLASAAGATQPSWPIFTDVTFPEQVGPDGGRATVIVTVGADATDIRLEVYGDDRMQVDPDNKLVVQVNALHPGQSFAFEVAFRPGPGRSYLAVSSHARFARVAGGAVREYPFGTENAEQLREHQKCVRQDPEGTWIHLMGCDDDPPPASPVPSTPTAAPSPPWSPPTEPARVPVAAVNIDVATLRGAPPLGRKARLEGDVVDSYRCPPCPPGAMCKPCVMRSAIFIADSEEHARFSWTDLPADVAAIAVDDPAGFAPGVRYRFEVMVPEQPRAEGIDATLIRSQRADEPIWLEPMNAEPRPLGKERPAAPPDASRR